MIRKYPSPLPGHIRVVFELPSCVWADRIFLTGDFNEWRQHDIELRQSRSGIWQATIDLTKGKSYQFRYLIDGQWRTDSHADGMSDNAYGSQNSIVVAELPDHDPHPHTPGLIRESRPLRPFLAQQAPQRPTPKTQSSAAA